MALNDLFCADVPLRNYSLTLPYTSVCGSGFLSIQHVQGYGVFRRITSINLFL